MTVCQGIACGRERRCGIIEGKMRLRTIALALALACGFSAAGAAKKNVIRPAAKSHKVKRVKGKRAKVGRKGPQHKAVKHH